MTLEGEVMGTPQYMSPEQAEGMVAELDARSDIYSLGEILYAILTLCPPIEGKTLNEVLTKVKKGEITSMVTKGRGRGPLPARTPAAMGVEVPDALQLVTLKAMATDWSGRYADVEALATDIEAYQNGFATTAENAGAVRQLVLFVKRNKGVAAAVALLLIAATVFTVKLAASERTARANESRALVEMEKSRREAARSALTLAEASEQDGEIEGMERALLSIPEDLHDGTWRYLKGKIDACDVEVLPPDKTEWVALEKHPVDLGLFIALRSDGGLCSLDPKDGSVAELWKAEARGRRLRLFAISDDGRSSKSFQE